MSTSGQFTASQIAAAVGLTKRAVLYALRHVPACGIDFVRGNKTPTWSYVALPDRLQERLRQKADLRGYRNAEALLAAPPAIWQPPIPLGELSQDCLNAAAALQRALKPVFTRLNDLNLSEAQFEAFGVRCYHEATGGSISGRHWRRLFDRTCARDGGAEDWDRLEIYLSERLGRRQSTPSPLQSPAAREINGILATFTNPAQPTREEVACLWVRIFERFEQQIAEGCLRGRVKKAWLAALLARAPFLTSSAEGLRKQFDEKLARWQTDRRPASIVDRRAEKSGRYRGPQLSQDDKDRLIAHARFSTGGRIAQAWRELLRENGLSEDLAAYYLANPARKSYVPRRIIDAVKPEVEMMEDIHHGPRQAKLNGAHISRDWSFVSASDWYQADDCTLPIFYYEADDIGGFTLWRGQFLLMIDLRSTCILGYVLLSSRNYNALAIRTLMTKVCDAHGLPRKGWYYERGVWERSKIITGGKRFQPALSNAETEGGLRDLGLRFIHANLPRSKPVEFVLGQFQNLLEGLPGYCGRDERHDRFERVQKLKLAVENGKQHPAGHFLSAEEWDARLNELCAQYNAQPQQGKMTLGLSPEDALARFQNAEDPCIRLDARCRYLLAHHRRPVRVTRNGITLRFGKQVFNYRGAQTGPLIGQTVFAWFNPETPEILTVTDTRRQNPFCIERSQDVPAMDAPAEMLGAEFQRIADHHAHTRARYRALRLNYAPKFRPNLVDIGTAELGRDFGEKQTAAAAQQKQSIDLGRRTAVAAAKISFSPARGRIRTEDDASEFEALVGQLRSDPSQSKSTNKAAP